jgi:hypothetical protein
MDDFQNCRASAWRLGPEASPCRPEGSDGSVVSCGIGMSGSHTARKSMLVQSGLIESDFRKREQRNLAAVAF